jgi:hypothetical protein
MTGIQSIKQLIYFACTDWTLMDKSLRHPPPPNLTNSIKILNPAQMVSLSEFSRLILRDSIQRRAILRAEANINGIKDEEDEDDEKIFMVESSELHYNISELIGSIFRTHGVLFYPIYIEYWHQIISDCCHPYCLKEDKQFAFFVISEVVEFGLNLENASSYLGLVLPNLINACSSYPIINQNQELEEGKQTGVDFQSKRACAYTIGIAAELYPECFSAFTFQALQGLGRLISEGDEDGVGSRGGCTDNAASAVGIILEKMDHIISTNSSFYNLWSEWLSYLPLKEDREEGLKVTTQLLRLINNRFSKLVAQKDRLVMSLSVILELIDDELITRELNISCYTCLQQLLISENGLSKDSIDAVYQSLPASLVSKLNNVLSAAPLSLFHKNNPDCATSPLATAPIIDVLMRR